MKHSACFEAQADNRSLSVASRRVCIRIGLALFSRDNKIYNRLDELHDSAEKRDESHQTG